MNDTITCIECGNDDAFFNGNSFECPHCDCLWGSIEEEIGKDKLNMVPFFNKQDLEFFVKITKELYDDASAQSKKDSERVKALWEKTRQWANSIKIPKIKVTTRNSWNIIAGKNNPGKNKYRHYTWSKLFDGELKNKEIFFTIGVEVDRKNNTAGLLIKIDGNHKKLSDKQYDAIRSFKHDNSIKDLYIPLAEVELYDIKSLKKLTEKYIEKHFSHYYGCIESVYSNEILIEDRIARICWNTEGWRFPSGSDGKSKGKVTGIKSYEAKHGYGHEEWLFNFDNHIDGYQYGFLEPINKFRDNGTYNNKKFNIYLFTRNFEEKKRYWVAKINNVEILNREQSEGALAHYKKEGWLDNMGDQIEDIFDESKRIEFNKWCDYKLFNIRFKIVSVDFFGDVPVPFSEGQELVKIDRYNLFKLKGDFDISSDDEQINNNESDEIIYSTTKDDLDKKGARIKKKLRKPYIEYEDLHTDVQNVLVKELQNEFPGEKIRKEGRTNYGNRIDVVRDTGYNKVFYEVKTYGSLKTCIRVALGQLLEYAHWPSNNRANTLVVVSYHEDKKDKVKLYFEKLSEIYNISLSYKQVKI